jgi:hypothetical protein
MRHAPRRIERAAHISGVANAEDIHTVTRIEDAFTTIVQDITARRERNANQITRRMPREPFAANTTAMRQRNAAIGHRATKRPPARWKASAVKRRASRRPDD